MLYILSYTSLLFAK